MPILDEIPFWSWPELRQLPVEADRIHESLWESTQAEAHEPRNNHGKGRNFTICLLQNQLASSIGWRYDEVVSTKNRTLPSAVQSNYEDSGESKDEDDDIEFDSDESDRNGVKEEARFHS